MHPIQHRLCQHQGAQRSSFLTTWDLYNILPTWYVFDIKTPQLRYDIMELSHNVAPCTLLPSNQSFYRQITSHEKDGAVSSCSLHVGITMYVYVRNYAKT